MLLALGIKTLLKNVNPKNIYDIKIYSQKAIDNSKKSEPKTVSFLKAHAHTLTCFCPNHQSLNVKQLNYILIENIVTLLYLPREHNAQT